MKALRAANATWQSSLYGYEKEETWNIQIKFKSIETSMGLWPTSVLIHLLFRLSLASKFHDACFFHVHESCFMIVVSRISFHFARQGAPTSHATRNDSAAEISVRIFRLLAVSGSVF